MNEAIKLEARYHYTVEIWCQCGAGGKVQFVTEGAAEQFVAVFDDQHKGKGHLRVKKADSLQQREVSKQGKREAPASDKQRR